MVSNTRRNGSAPFAALLPVAVALALAGCSTMGDVLPEKTGGLPANAPERPTEARPFPNVYEVRPTREAAPLNDDEQKKLESELVTLREQQKQLANPPPPPPPPKKVATPAKKAVPKAGSAKASAAKASAAKLGNAKAAAPKVATPAKKKQNEAVVPEQTGPAAAPKLIN